MLDVKGECEVVSDSVTPWTVAYQVISLKVIAVVAKALIFNRLSSYFILEMKHILHLHKTYFIPQHRCYNWHPLAPRQHYTKGPQRFQNYTYHI